MSTMAVRRTCSRIDPKRSDIVFRGSIAHPGPSSSAAGQAQMASRRVVRHARGDLAQTLLRRRVVGEVDQARQQDELVGGDHAPAAVDVRSASVTWSAGSAGLVASA